MPYADTCSTDCTTTTTVWYGWNSDSARTASMEWESWCTAYTTGTFRAPTARFITPKADPKVERRRVRKAKAARLRAERLLQEHLDEQQRREMAERGLFQVRGPSGKVYEIDTSKQMHNVFELDARGRRIRELCIYTPGVPQGDNLLAQKLMIEADEEGFRRIANHKVLAG